MAYCSRARTSGIGERCHGYNKLRGLRLQAGSKFHQSQNRRQDRRGLLRRLSAKVEGSARLRNSFEEEVNHETPSRRSLAGRGAHRVISERVRLGSRKFGRARNSVHKNLGGINYERKEISTSSPQCRHRFGTHHYTEQGTGPVALFVHGVLLNGYLWRHQLEDLSDIRRCIALDLLAHGDTEIAPNQDVSVTANAKILKEFLDVLHIDQVDLVGNDSGGGIAQIFTALYPERVRSLTLTDCDAHDNWPPEAFSLLAWLPPVACAEHWKRCCPIRASIARRRHSDQRTNIPTN
jgi:hypothetical protein